MSQSTNISSEFVTQIHPINAQYLLQSEPHRLYGDNGGNKLEIIVERFASNVFEVLYNHGGIIAVGYHDATTDGVRSFERAFILSPRGKIQAFYPTLGLINIGLHTDLFYMLLNQVEMNNWLVLDKKAVEAEGMNLSRDIGLGNASQLYGLKRSTAIMKELYIRLVK